MKIFTFTVKLNIESVLDLHSGPPAEATMDHCLWSYAGQASQPATYWNPWLESYLESYIIYRGAVLLPIKGVWQRCGLHVFHINSVYTLRELPDPPWLRSIYVCVFLRGEH